MTEQEDIVVGEKTAYLLISIESTFYAIDASDIQEILELPALQYIKSLPLYIAGFVNLRGEIIVVLDLKVCIGECFQSYSLNDYLIILKGENYAFGIIVPKIYDLVQLDISNTTSKAIVNKLAPLFPFLSHIAKYREQIVFLINPTLLEKYVFQTVPEVFKPGALESFENKMNVPPLDLEEHRIFQERAKRLAEKVQVASCPDHLSLLAIVELNQEYFAFDTLCELCPLYDFTPIPHAPPYVFGLFNLRGHVVPIIDILQILQGKISEIKKTSKILVVNFENIPVGILINDMVNLVSSCPLDYRIVPLSVKAISEAFIKSTIKYEKKVIPILDIFKILKSIQIQSGKEFK